MVSTKPGTGQTERCAILQDRTEIKKMGVSGRRFTRDKPNANGQHDKGASSCSVERRSPAESFFD